MISYLNEHKDEVGAVVVLRFDRIHQNLLNSLKFVQTNLIPNDIQFSSVMEPFDTTTPVGKMTLSILTTFAEYQEEADREPREEENRAGGII
ncbi:recombinase family protein [Aneurinibacillus tyrosinisolvens]|uniref:recombinase family protein n=1 Tax=Aneurinibacillus tyrosinisolvens TaxID=1443435 RepID=UPI00069B33EA|nr:recombinase family protein [Aneurinibacillus tyrosinisolvens]